MRTPDFESFEDGTEPHIAVGVGTIFNGLPASNIVPFAIAGIEMRFGCWLTWISCSTGSTDRQSGQTGG